ncbi:hypothetical protein K9857_04950 [Pseudomonas sp. REP124]|uniref:hypothetical protein n=1 Tax=Pseudomonas sp. REP124 TaxID=2875731 RepID=UPI001CCC5229|nr:hypothetical protein [Pseudomonas sp. REP124]MBZ9780897.1 hypothetical protein [Pseudomonas sp. REP124]
MRVILINIAAANQALCVADAQKDFLGLDQAEGKSELQKQKTPVFRPGSLLSIRIKR